MAREINPIIVGTLSAWVNPTKVSMVNPSVFGLIIIPEPIQVVPIRKIHPSNSMRPKGVHRICSDTTQTSHARDTRRRPPVNDPKVLPLDHPRNNSCSDHHEIPDAVGHLRIVPRRASRIRIFGFGIRVPSGVVPIPTPFAHVSRDVIKPKCIGHILVTGCFTAPAVFTSVYVLMTIKIPNRCTRIVKWIATKRIICQRSI